MALLVGALLAFSVGLWASGVGLDRDRAFYPVVTIVIASYYALFAVMGASTHALVLESLVCAVISNPGVPDWWPEFCLAYDVTAAVYLAWLITSGRVRAAAD